MYKIGTPIGLKTPKTGVITAESPYHAQVWEPPPPPGLILLTSHKNRTFIAFQVCDIFVQVSLKIAYGALTDHVIDHMVIQGFQCFKCFLKNPFQFLSFWFILPPDCGNNFLCLEGRQEIFISGRWKDTDDIPHATFPLQSQIFLI